MWAQVNMMTENNLDRILSLSESEKSVPKEFRSQWALVLMSLTEQITKLELEWLMLTWEHLLVVPQ